MRGDVDTSARLAYPRRVGASSHTQSAEPTQARDVPHTGWPSVGEALAVRQDPRGVALLARCREVGQTLAEAGAGVAEALAELRSTTRHASHREPSYDELAAVAEGWAETTLDFLGRLSCVDPLTGLASAAHLRELLVEHFRRPGCEGCVLEALVVAEAPVAPDAVEHAMRMTLLGEASRSAFPAAVSVGRLSARRVVVVVARDIETPVRARLLRRMAPNCQVWTETLPGTESAAVALLDEIACT